MMISLNELAASRGRDRARVAISGASGMVGQALQRALADDGAEVLRLVRSPAKTPDEVSWSTSKGLLRPERLEDCDALITLQGANIAGGRWSRKRKDLLRSSRVDALRALAASCSGLETGPKILISASGVGIYGASPESRVDESSPKGSGFLAELAADWESAALDLGASLEARVALLRLGVVLSPEGGALSKMLPPFRLGLGGPLGRRDGKMSWVALDDVVGVVGFLLKNPLEGAFNVVAPQVVTQIAFAEALGKAVHRPAIFPVPSFALRSIFGEMADETLLADQEVVARRLAESGFEFEFGRLDDALKHLLAPRL